MNKKNIIFLALAALSVSSVAFGMDEKKTNPKELEQEGTIEETAKKIEEIDSAIEEVSRRVEEEKVKAPETVVVPEQNEQDDQPDILRSLEFAQMMLKNYKKEKMGETGEKEGKIAELLMSMMQKPGDSEKKEEDKKE